ncbi:hypothetical protein QYM36_008932 [Artemia franciscana]|uniref:Glycosyltransferase family 92 protein n=2 Tax=Artemia franciscana TaxID=6661 RepID=A0AA88L6J6_ARTSF|nr:hypothetical protein QYM36_008932 [Artemia franciscana]
MVSRKRFLPRVLRRVGNRGIDSSFLFVIAFFFIFCTVISLEIFLVDKKSIQPDIQDSGTMFRKRVISEEKKGFFGSFLSNEQDGIEMDLEFPDIGDCLETGLCPWQPVKGMRAKFYVFSAYVDLRKKSTIKIIGATKTKYPEKPICLFGFQKNSTFDTQWKAVQSNVKVIRENWNLKYSAVFIYCPMSNEIPDFVSISSNGSLPFSRSFSSTESIDPKTLVNGNILPILNRNPPATTSELLGVCVKPFHFEWNQAINLLEFLELHKLLGVTHFTFYNNSVGHEVDCILREYMKKGEVTMLPWKLNIISQKQIRTEGLFASLNDCVYRNMFKSEYLLLIDLDEFILPHMNNTYMEMLDFLHTKSKKEKIGAYSFQNGFFYQQFPRDTSVNLPIDLLTQIKTQRRKKLHPHKQRSKYICKPNFIQEAGNHFIWEFEAGKGTVQVPPDVGYLHHYRVCEFGGDDCVKEESMIDRTAHKYQSELLKSVLAAIDDIGSVCKLKL